MAWQYFTYSNFPIPRDWGDYMRGFERRQNALQRKDDPDDNTRGHMVVYSQDFDPELLPDEVKAKLTAVEENSVDGKYFWWQKQIDDDKEEALFLQEKLEKHNALLAEEQAKLDAELENLN